ncbi:non-ribosomal peptide synthetase [Fictibacillus fluitans]|uniref:Amino acid adenylation domain-containing protein n=1 Tax=Fictibacillus fluitans TaxID=3058422 RepID=A0ABT8HTK5_9BACL|nr:non-ribosomal peptide synthetase [Fictibacillus sp. NE201]MDN4524086.1 amino acid adenylation domain-containing protein [Fictibacillus sp. NE201]
MTQPLNKSLVEDIVALSPIQEGILYHCLKSPQLPLYISQVSLQVEGRIETHFIQEAFDRVVQENECLRSVIRWEKISHPVQIVMKKVSVTIQEEDLSLLSASEKEIKVKQVRERKQKEGFDLSNGPLAGIVIFKEQPGRYQILFQFHHIILDGWSLGVILSEWFKTYDLLLRNKKWSPGSKPKYKSYIKWLQNYNQDKASEFWKEELSSFSSHTKLPYQINKRHSGMDNSCISLSFSDLLPKVEVFSRTYGVTINAVINSAWGLLLQHYNDSDEAIFGLTISGRPDELPGVQQIAGLFINTIPFITRKEENSTIVEYIRGIHQQMIRCKSAEQLPLSEIQRSAGLKGTEALFNHILVFENYPLDQQLMTGAFSDFKITGYKEAEINHYDLTVSFLLAGDPELKLEYNANLFDRQTIEQMGRHFLSAMSQLISRPEELVNSLSLVTDEEYTQLLKQFNDTETTYSNQEKAVYELFVQQAKRTPDETAVIFQQDSLSYRELAAGANRLGCHLKQQGEGEGHIVAILMDWSTEMITAIMGVLGSGSAYLPIDPGYPEERIRYIVNNSRAQVIITSEQYSAMAASLVPNTVIMAKGDFRAGTGSGKVLSGHGEKLVDFPLAYVIYTSGSTGQPKGVMIDQQAFTEFVLWAVEEYEHRAGYQVLLSNSFAFDSSIQQIFPPLVTGGTLHLLHPSVRMDARQYLRYLKEKRINNMDEIPVLMNVLVEAAAEEYEGPLLGDLTSLSLGSEYVPISLVKKCKKYLISDGKIINGYGPAETTVETCTYHFTGEQDEISLVGKPRSNLKVYIVDKKNRLCPIGVPGEICVSGLGLSKGYLNQPELTAERFISNPFSSISGDKMYKTGDVGQWMPDGNVQYIGRMDHQIKIRGYRVEPGEIEETLLTHPLIHDAVVVAQNRNNFHVLCAFLKSYDAPAQHELKRFLADVLPDYMVPSFFQFVDEYPKTPNGKVDRSALERSDTGGFKEQRDTSMPRHELDEKLVKIWESVLQLQHIGVHTNFFEIGGNSIQLMRVFSKLKKEMPDVTIDISDFFSYNTISELADYIQKPNESKKSVLLSDSKKDRANETKNQDIAIVGLGIRLPGITGPDEFWKLLENEKSTIQEIQTSRKELDPKGFEEKNYLRYGYLEDIDHFEPQFFGITPKVAKYMDPNQRIMLETAYFALEDAGYSKEKVKDRPIGVFMGAVLPEYHHFLNIRIDELLSSNLPANLAGRLSYHFGFNGPSLVIDTACSSSLAALHSAMQSLRNEECEMAMVGGIHLDVAPVRREEAMESNIVSPTESCKAFSEDADGTIGGEGCICVLLKPLNQALTDNDRVYAVVKGSGVVQDGARSNGITSPSPDAQAETLLKAWRDAGIDDPKTISFIEAHGTGTKIGDPIEVKGIQKAVQSFTNEKQFIALGSVKSNIGHLDSAAGLAGLAKAALSLKNGQVPASLYTKKLNPLIHFDKSPVFINKALTPVGANGDSPPRAGVSSFGLSGTNVHVVLEKYEQLAEKVDNLSAGPYLMTLSASTENKLAKKIQDLQTLLKERNGQQLKDISYTLNCRRSHEEYRFAAIAKDTSELIQQLNGPSKISSENQESVLTVQLQDYETGSEQLYEELCQSGFFNDEELKKYSLEIDRYQENERSARLAKYVSFLSGIVQLLRHTGLTLNITGTGIGALAADYINGGSTLKHVIDSWEEGNERSSVQEGYQEGMLLSIGHASNLNAGQQKADLYLHEAKRAAILQLLAKLYLSGMNMNFKPLQEGKVVSLPVYPFQRKSYWLDMNEINNQKVLPRDEQKKSSLNSVSHLLHHLAWKPKELTRQNRRPLRGTIVIAGEHSDLENLLASQLRKEGRSVLQIQYGPEHTEKETEQLLHEIKKAGIPMGAFIYLSKERTEKSLHDLRYPKSDHLSAVIEAQLQTILNTGKILAAQTEEGPLPMFQITFNADKVEPSDIPVDPLQSLNVSLNRSLNREYPQLQAYSIDFSAYDQSLEAMVERIVQEVTWYQEIREIAYRGSNRYVKQLQRKVLDQPERDMFRKNGVYVVTGGAGGLAAEVCRSIANKVNATFLLLGRSAYEQLSEEQLTNMRELKALGASVEYFSVNIADFSALQQMVKQISSTYKKIDGVIHTAGVMGNRVPFGEASLYDFKRVFESKVYGTVYLDYLLRDQMLDFFILFSSVDAVLSEQNIGPYTSANHFMDQYALHQRQLGKNFISVQWGGWQLTGMGDAARKGKQESLINEIKRLSLLILGFERQDGLLSFHQLVSSNASHTLVTGLNTQDLQEIKDLSFFELSSELQILSEKKPEHNAEPVTLESITASVASLWKEILELDEEPGLKETYFSLGGDSIQGLDITVELSELYELELDANILFRHETIEALSQYIHEQLNKSTQKEVSFPIPKATPLS